MEAFMEQILVLGGGAAGIAAAISAAESAPKGTKVLLIEQNPRIGKKLLATGNGRCNLDNTGLLDCDGEPVVISDEEAEEAAGEVFKEHLLEALRSVVPHVEDDGDEEEWSEIMEDAMEVVHRVFRKRGWKYHDYTHQRGVKAFEMGIRENGKQLHVKVYGDEDGKEQYGKFSGSSATISFDPSILGDEAKRITLQLLQEGGLTITVKNVHLIRKDGTLEPCTPSPFWGCSVEIVTRR